MSHIEACLPDEDIEPGTAEAKWTVCVLPADLFGWQTNDTNKQSEPLIMRIGFDIDDTITRCPVFFAVVTSALIASGNKVYIISFREDREFAEEDLADHQIAFDTLVLPTEQEYRSATDNNWREGAAEWKAEVCRRLKIDLLFDDMPEVVNALPSETVGIMVVEQSLGKVKYDGR